MRAFDQRNSYLDNEGKPLIGRVSFYKKDTNVLETITDVAGSSLANPVYTNTLGQLVYQVYLQDYTDYSVKFEKYIGNGDFTDDPDINNWLFLYSCDNLFDVYGISVECDGVQAVNTISDLIAFDPQLLTNNRNFIQVLGYNELGDCEPVYYQWDANSTETTNGGSVIQSSVLNYGRWKLVNTFIEYLDVRHFGVFGTPTRQTASSTMGTQILAAQNYAISIGKKLYFPSIDNDITWYNFRSVSALNLSLYDSNVWIFDDTSTSHIIYVEENSGLNVYGDGNFTLSGDTVRTSWGENSTRCTFDPSYKLIIDSVINTNQRSWTGIYIDCFVETSNIFLYECTINSVKKLGDNCYFRGCRLTESMFSDACDFDTITIHNNVVIDLEDWPTTWKWLKLRVQKPNQTIDFNGRTLYDNCNGIINWVSDVTFKNATFTNGFIITQSTIGLENCGGPVQMNASLQALVIDNCNIAITVVQLTSRPNVVIKNNSEVTFTNDEFYAGEFSAHDSVITGIINANVHVVGYNTIFYNAITVNGVLNLQKCTVNGAITQRANDANFVVTLLNNTLGDKYYMYGAPLLQSVVSGKIEYNNSNASQTAIVIDRTNFDPDESNHKYSYKYNTGSFIQDKTFIQGTYLAKTRHYFSGTENTFAQNNQEYHAFVVPTETNFGAVYNTTVPFENVTFFTIGTTNINVKMKVRTMINNGLSNTSFVDIILKGIHKNDYTWGLVANTSGNWPLGPGGFYAWKQFPAYYPTNFILGDVVHVEESSTLPSDYNIDMIIDYELIR